jgi:hypothetical protein
VGVDLSLKSVDPRWDALSSALRPILRTRKLLVRRPHAPDIGVWASEDFPTTTCFRRFDMGVGTSTSAVRNHHGGNSFRVCHMRTAPVVGYGRSKDHPSRTAFTRSSSEMESIMNTKRNTDGLQRPWCTLGLSTMITLRSPLDRPSRLYSGHRGLLGVALLRHALGNLAHGQCHGPHPRLPHPHPAMVLDMRSSSTIRRGQFLAAVGCERCTTAKMTIQ